MSLSEADRAALASRLLDSLAADDEIAVVTKRREEMTNDPTCIITLKELQRSVGR